MPLQCMAGGHVRPLEHLPASSKVTAEGRQLCSTECPPLCSLSPLPVRQATPRYPHPSLELHFPTLRGLYHTCYQESIAVNSCHMETPMELGTGTYMLPLLSLAPTG